MWTPVFLLLLAGAVTANHNGWNSEKEYTFKIRSRTMAALHPSNDQFTGVLMKGTLRVQPKDSDTLLAKLTKTKYAQIHTKLPGGWDSEIPDNQMRLEEFPMTGKTFEIKMKHGVVRDLVVDKEVPTWEVNILKSIVSQLQVDTQGENRRKSKHNHGPEGDQPFAMYKTMEDSVGGKCEVLYDIAPLPEKVWSGNYELVPKPELVEDQNLIEIVKTKNYSKCEQRMSFHYGMVEDSHSEFRRSDNGPLLTKSSVSRIVVSGDLRRFTIQSSETTNKILLSPGLNSNNHKGMVVSRMRLSLSQVESPNDRLSMPSSPQSTGNLVYNFNSPFSGPEQRRPGRPSISPNSRSDSSSSSEENDKNRNRKSNNERRDSSSSSSSDSSSSSSDSSSSSSDSTASREDRQFWQPRPSLNEAPENPLLPYFVGNKGNSIQMSGSIDPVRKTKELANEIGHELQNPSDIPKEETLDKFLILTRLIRTMNTRQIEEAQKDLFESSNQINSGDKSSSRRNSWAAFRDAVAQAGTGPALVTIKKMIENKKIEGFEAAQVVASTSESALIPTPEYVETFFKLATMPETQNQPFLRESALHSFADLVRNTIVDKRKAHNLYPVHSFGRLFSKQNTDLFKVYIPHLSRELRSAMKEGNSPKIQTYIVALGKIAHPKVLAAFEPYLEEREPSSKHQRLLMVFALSDMTETYPKVARSVSYKIYANTGENHELRSAAVRMLMKTNPPASMLQRMAEMTNQDENNHVNSAVKSAIESASNLEDPRDSQLAINARAARGLLNKEKYGPQYSRNIVTELWYKEMEFKLHSSYIGSKDNIIPKELFLAMKGRYGGLELSNTKFASTVSSVEDLLSYLEREYINNKSEEERDSDSRGSNVSADRISQMLKIEADGPKQIEGNALFNNRYFSQFVAFDNHTLDHLPKMLKRASESLREGYHFNVNRFTIEEKILSFPTETGFPFTYTFRMPSLVKAEGKAKLRTEPESSENKNLPRRVDASSEMRFVHSSKIQERVGFLTPFEHNHYMAGEDNNLQIYLPIRIEAEVNSENKEIKVKIQPSESKESFKIFHISNVPYTAKHNMLTMKPALRDSENTRVVRKQEIKKHTKNLSDLMNSGSQSSIEFEFEQEQEQEQEQGEKDRRSKHWFSSIVSDFDVSSSRSSYRKLSVKMTPKSDNSENSIKWKLSYDSKRKSQSDRDENRNSGESSDKSTKAKAPYPSDKESNSESRKTQFLNEASWGIESAQSRVIDTSLEMSGKRPVRLALTAAWASSNVDEKSRSLLYANSQDERQVDYEVCAALKTKTPNVPELNFEEILKSKLTEEFDADIRYGKDCSSGAKIRVEGERKQSKEYNQAVRQSEEAKQVERLEDGDSQKTSAYQTLVQRASELDETEVTVKFNDQASRAKEYSMKLLELATRNRNDIIEMDTVNPKNSDKDKIDLKIRNTWGNGAYVTINGPNMDVSMRNVLLENIIDSNSEAQQSSESSEEDVSESMWELESSCFLDKRFVDSFDNNVIPYELGKCWHVVMTTFPKEDPDRPSHDRPIPKDMETIILARENEDGKKEVKIVLGNKEIRLKKHSSRIEVTVDGNQVSISKRKSFEERSKEKDLEGKRMNRFEIYELEDGSVKVISESNGVDVVFGGQRIKITAANRYRNSIRGICGNFDSESYNDQKTPKNCQLRNPKEFTASWALTADKCEGPALKYAENAKRAHCSRDSSRPSNFINDEEAGRERSSSSWGHHNEESKKSSHCTSHRTKVTRTETHTCFSLRPVPTCSHSCRAVRTKEKDIEMHCVNNNNAAEKLADRIEKGANPDLSQKPVSKKETMKVPVSCQAA